jgi:hypothetical protein
MTYPLLALHKLLSQPLPVRSPSICFFERVGDAMIEICSNYRTFGVTSDGLLSMAASVWSRLFGIFMIPDKKTANPS